MGGVIRMAHGSCDSNAYILTDSGEAAIVDAGVGEGRLAVALVKAKEGYGAISVRYVLLTHGHMDHMESLDAYRGMTGAPAHIHASDADFLTDPAKNLSVMLGGARSASAAEATLEDGQALPFGSGFIKVIHTPGHTKGGACFLFGDALFTGDTLFSDSVGRTDLPGGSHDELMGSIRNRILPLGGGVRIYPGHGVGCLIGELGSRNRFIAPGP